MPLFLFSFIILFYITHVRAQKLESSFNISPFCVSTLLPLGCSTLTQQITVKDNKKIYKIYVSY